MLLFMVMIMNIYKLELEDFVKHKILCVQIFLNKFVQIFYNKFEFFVFKCVPYQLLREIYRLRG